MLWRRDIYSQKFHIKTINISIPMPITETYEMGTQGQVKKNKNLDRIFTRAHHETLSGNHVDLVVWFISPTQYTTQVISVTQALRAKERVVTIEHGDKKWIVDLDKMEQKPVVQPFMQYKFRQVRHLNMDSSFSRVIPRWLDRIPWLLQKVIFFY